MNTTDQTFIRAYGSDFVPSYADEAARAADYPALADSNVNAVFGSMPRQRHYRVDGPSVTPSPSVRPVPSGNAPAPLPARPYQAHQASSQPQPRAATPPDAYQTQQPAESPRVAVPYRFQPRQPVPQTSSPAPSHDRDAAPMADRGDIDGAHLEDAHLDDVHLDDVHLDDVHLDDVHLDGAIHGRGDERQVAGDAERRESPAPATTHARVPRPHIDFATVKHAESQSTVQEPQAQPPVEKPNRPSPVLVSPALRREDGLAMLADSSLVIGTSTFEWPAIEPTVAPAPTVAKMDIPTPDATAPAPTGDAPAATAVEVTQPTASRVAPAIAAAGVKAEAEVAPPASQSEVQAVQPESVETPLRPAITNIDKDATGAEMEADADAAEPVRHKLKPAWEVDRLLWPVDADQLYESEGEYFRHAGEKLRDASHEGLRVLGVSSSHSGEGCTTLAICLARAAAAAGAKVALLDANLRSPQLGSALGLDFARSWHEALNGKTPLAEAAVTAIADNVTLLPLSKHALRQGLKLDSDAFNEVLRVASETFDLVLVDIGSPLDEGRNSFQSGDACPLDAAIVVRDVRVTSEEETLDSVSRFRSLGIDAVGIAENFATASVAQAAA